MSPLAAPSSKRILIVDDDQGVVDVLEVVVRKEGFQVETAYDGASALEKIQKSAPDLVLLDFIMPGYDGFQVLKRLKELPAGGIPVIVISGRVSDQKLLDLIKQESNVVEFLEKPIKGSVLMNHIHRALGTEPPALKRLQTDIEGGAKA